MQEKIKISGIYFENQLNMLHWEADVFFSHLIQTDRSLIDAWVSMIKHRTEFYWN